MVALLLALPFVGIGVAPRLLIGPLATLAARPLARAGAALEAHRSSAAVEPPAPEPDADRSEAAAESMHAAEPTSHAPRRADRARGAPSHGLFVARSVVESAIRARRRPSGYAVPADGSHPAGVAVAGGAGPLRAGDVITEVEGRPVRSVEDVIVAVGGAARAKAKAVSGRFWRGGEPWTITVETPW
jgi:hypothetical protein